MKFKDIETAIVLVSPSGTISIEQYSPAHDEPVRIFLTLDQFKQIENWVFKNKDELELLWNDGVKDE